LTNPDIKVGADVGAVTAGIQKVGAEADKANKSAQTSLRQARKELQGYVGYIDKARRAFEGLQKSGARGTRSVKGQSFDDYIGGGWRAASINNAAAKRMLCGVPPRVGHQPWVRA